MVTAEAPGEAQVTAEVPEAPVAATAVPQEAAAVPQEVAAEDDDRQNNQEALLKSTSPPDASVGVLLPAPPGGVPGQALIKEKKVKIF